jgi:two-component system response regulator RegA
MTREKILVVDDDILFAKTLANSIQKRGFLTFVANDIETAIGLVAAHMPDKAVIDLKIGHDSGLSLLATFKELNPAIKMLILTGYSSIATAVSAIKLGAHDYVCKPVDADEVLAAFSPEGALKGPAVIRNNPPSVRRLQWEHVQKVLEENDGNISVTARALDMHRRTLQRFLQKRPVAR